MEPKHTDNLYMNKTSPYDIDVHMFPLSTYSEKLILSKYHELNYAIFVIVFN